MDIREYGNMVIWEICQNGLLRRNIGLQIISTINEKN